VNTFVAEQINFVADSDRNREPVERTKCGGDVIRLFLSEDETSGRVLDAL
jgi:hypothetical protein